MKALISLIIPAIISPTLLIAQSYTIVDTNQQKCFDNRKKITAPAPGKPFSGQDAQYSGNQPKYQDNNDGTITDLNTKLMWTASPGEKVTYKQAVAGAKTCKTADYTDWRLPTIKELYSLIDFSGIDPLIEAGSNQKLKPFINDTYFKFNYGSSAQGDRIIDSQFATSTVYKSTTMGDNQTMFGVNFADGRIKGYPINISGPRPEKTYYALYVRENPDYGKNNYIDNNDGTITDKATGLMWTKYDSGYFKAGDASDGTLNFQQALTFAENLEFAGHDDWRLPNAKELQSIVDYSRCPDTTNSAAIDQIFQTTEIKNEIGEIDFPYFWTGTTHISTHGPEAAVYISFGRANGYMFEPRLREMKYMDVHGAGAQRSDPKYATRKQVPNYRGPQGDIIRTYNFARLVRNAE